MEVSRFLERVDAINGLATNQKFRLASKKWRMAVRIIALSSTRRMYLGTVNLGTMEVTAKELESTFENLCDLQLRWTLRTLTYHLSRAMTIG